MIKFTRLRALAAVSVSGLFLAAILPASGVPATLSLENLVHTYDGTPKTPTAVTDPPGLDVTWRYFDPAAAAPEPFVETVYDSTPSPLALSYSSHSFSSQGTCGLGDRVQLAGTARNLTSVDVVLVTWAKAATYPALALANPAGWHHPIKMSVYDMDGAGILALVGEISQSIFIPWRPLTLPNGQNYPYNGYAFQAHFEFPAGMVLPEKPVFMVSYNTGGAGFEPIGLPGPYNELNVAGADGPSIGTDDNPTASLWVRSATSWVYPAVGTKPPMMVVKASRVPEAGSATPPTNAGTWLATAKITAAGYEGEAVSNFTIQPAAAQIILGNLSQIADGTAKSASFTTLPADLAVQLTYNGGPDLPVELGKYQVHSTIQNPNYTGSADGELWLGQNLQSWLGPWVLNGSIGAAETGPNDDPDHDSISNLLEYALGLDPSTANPSGVAGSGVPMAEFAGQTLSLIYRKNLAATDLVYQVQTTTGLGESAMWEPATTVDSEIDTQGFIQTIRASLASVPSEDHRFVRLSVVRAPSN